MENHAGMVSFRAATDADAARLAAFARETFIATFGADNRPEDMADFVAQHFQPEIQRREIANPRLTTLLAESDDALVAYAQLREDANPPPGVRRTGSIELWRFYIASAWHGQGMAQRFLREVVAVARARHADSLWLGVWEHNLRARRFYEKCGFVRVGQHDFVLGADVQTDLVLEASFDTLDAEIGRAAVESAPRSQVGVSAADYGLDSIQASPLSPAMRALLEEAGLPVDDLAPNHGIEFFVAGPPDRPDGVVGLDRPGSVGLLRSLAVASNARGRGLGTALVAAVEQHARASGLSTLYLLTTTADRFFEALGYSRIAREAAPIAVTQTAQFSALCPSTAVFMSKTL